ncbi:MAG: hypothetical protein LBR39_06805 [Coriobacteriales bacterium]|nr:hypothetical protein [Coriobacteriales bacterium]
MKRPLIRQGLTWLGILLAAGVAFVWAPACAQAAELPNNPYVTVITTPDNNTALHTVIFNSGGNGEASQWYFAGIPTGSDFSTVIPTTPVPKANAGYHFAGWDPALPARIESDLVFNARFEPGDAGSASGNDSGSNAGNNAGNNAGGNSNTSPDNGSGAGSDAGQTTTTVWNEVADETPQVQQWEPEEGAAALSINQSVPVIPAPSKAAEPEGFVLHPAVGVYGTIGMILIAGVAVLIGSVQILKRKEDERAQEQKAWEEKSGVALAAPGNAGYKALTSRNLLP